MGFFETTDDVGSGVGGGRGGGGIEIAPGVRLPAGAVVFRFSRAGGPGGQNVNKVNTRAELRVALAEVVRSARLDQAGAARLRRSAGRRLTAGGEIVIVSARHREQGRNREDCVQRLRGLVVEAMHAPKVRRGTRPTKASRARRLEGKKRRGGIKARRGSVRGEEE